MSWVYVIVVVVALKHLVLMAIARRNTRKLLLRGGYEVGAGHYPVFVVIFTAWFLTMLIFVDPEEVVNPWWIISYVVLQFFRVQTMMSLGKYWTERVITIPGAPLVRSGLYQFIRHPNYLIVIGEVISVPMTLNCMEDCSRILCTIGLPVDLPDKDRRRGTCVAKVIVR